VGVGEGAKLSECGIGRDGGGAGVVNGGNIENIVDCCDLLEVCQ
jgi:hypothetical protein